MARLSPRFRRLPAIEHCDLDQIVANVTEHGDRRAVLRRAERVNLPRSSADATNCTHGSMQGRPPMSAVGLLQ